MTDGARHNPETIRAALNHVSADCDRDTWVRVLAALKSWDGDSARELAQEWSARSATYKAADFRAAWKSLRAEGGVTVGTLLALAKEGGFSLASVTSAKPAPAAARDRTAEHAARERDEEARRAQKRERAAAEALRRWAAASVEGKSPYLERKGVRPHGVRFEAGGALLVPMLDAAGDLRSLQTIAADGGKKFLPGGQAVDLLHWIGDPAGAAHLALCEGYATAATIHEASGLPVAVAFNAGNLPHVARIVREGHPAALLVICADDDRETAARSNKNPGMNAAREAARGGSAVVAIPAPLEPGETDFNDLAKRLGLPAVAAIVADAMAKHTLREDADSDASPAVDASDGDPFRVTDRGVYYRATDRNGVSSLQWVCGPLTVEARTRDADGASWGYLLAFNDPEGAQKRIAIPGRLFAADGVEVRAQLLDEGHAIAAGPAKNRLGHYIATRRPGSFVRVAETIGWHGDWFVLPHRSFGAGSAGLFYQTGHERTRNPFRERGTLDAWRSGVAKLCQGNPRLVFPVALAFAGPTLHLLEAMGGRLSFLRRELERQVNGAQYRRFRLGPARARRLREVMACHG
jgi:putative DNA primase/helicase